MIRRIHSARSAANGARHDRTGIGATLSCGIAAPAAEICRFTGTTDYSGHVAVTTRVTASASTNPSFPLPNTTNPLQRLAIAVESHPKRSHVI
jgi:hypothetical protein